MDSNLLTIQNLTFGWGEEPLFANICCQLNTGEIAQLKGENGAGKTTLLQLMTGMIPHFQRGKILSGNILVYGKSIFKSSPKHFFPTIAFIPGVHLELFLLTENLYQEMLFCSAILNIPRSDINARRDEFSGFFPIIADIMHEPFVALDRAQKVLALTFIFFLQGATLFLFDEELNAFDDQQRQQWLAFFQMLKSKQRTVVFVSHHIDVPTDAVWLIKHQRLELR
ncbi:MAG: ATP-binding cassette domain-containing protein [candidate division KSB1 bacterium]|nr:ATP-binding cassette domain-containing protein [candidate division KSB1 bacterium]MDZ7319027.1 ATP-binding cassette domain-containing protein [candidate division KSB1 bacterium]MDZ7341444.1 ATP-binding cassette domain-containing protein [candidate division KSB1 bacterium]